MQREHRETDGFAHATHLAVAALMDREADHRAAIGRFEHPDLSGRADHTGLELDAVREFSEFRGRGFAIDANAVVLLDAIARMHELVRKFAVVREDQ